MNSHTYNYTAINNGISPANESGVAGSFRDYANASANQIIFSLSHRNPFAYKALCRARSAT
jgi:hypothetical protein